MITNTLNPWILKRDYELERELTRVKITVGRFYNPYTRHEVNLCEACSKSEHEFGDVLLSHGPFLGLCDNPDHKGPGQSRLGEQAKQR
jgi:hypothetical protein